MTDRLMFFLLGLTGRERVLLALLCAVVLPAALWLGLVQPLQQRRDDARTALAEALILQTWVGDRVQEGRRLSRADQGLDTPPIGVAGLEQSLIDAGLRDRVSELTRRGGDEIELRFDAVDFTRLGDWINRVALDWGYEIATFRVERGDGDGQVAARFSLVPQR